MKNYDLPMRSGWKWFTDGWKIFKKSPVQLILGAVMWIILELVVAFIPIIGGVIDGLIFPILCAGFLFTAHEIQESRKPVFGHFFIGFTDKTKLMPLLTLGFLIVLFEMVSIATAMTLGPLSGVILLPLAIILFSALLYSLPLITFTQAKVTEALKSSYRSCGNNLSAIIMMYFVLLALMFLSVATFGLGLIVIIPFTFCSLYISYRDIYG